jgi:hypothetical protein
VWMGRLGRHRRPPSFFKFQALRDHDRVSNNTKFAAVAVCVRMPVDSRVDIDGQMEMATLVRHRQMNEECAAVGEEAISDDEEAVKGKAVNNGNTLSAAERSEMLQDAIGYLDPLHVKCSE